jgi:hypothetical protein
LCFYHGAETILYLLCTDIEIIVCCKSGELMQTFFAGWNASQHHGVLEPQNADVSQGIFLMALIAVSTACIAVVLCIVMATARHWRKCIGTCKQGESTVD